MNSHKVQRRSARQWLRDDLRKAIGFRGAARLIRQHPRLLWSLVTHLMVAYGILVVVLVVFGRRGSFEDLAGFPAILARSLFGERLYRQREESARAVAQATHLDPADRNALAPA